MSTGTLQAIATPPACPILALEDLPFGAALHFLAEQPPMAALLALESSSLADVVSRPGACLCGGQGVPHGLLHAEAACCLLAWLPLARR